MSVGVRPSWWPDDFTVEALAAQIMGDDFENAMYRIFGADLDCVVRQVDREHTAAPDGFNPYRVQLYVNKGRVTNYEIG